MSFNETMKALSAPERREILNLLKDGSMTAGKIGEHFEMTGATMSYHLATLKKAGLITETKDKNYIYYSLNASVLEELMLWIKDLKDADAPKGSKAIEDADSKIAEDPKSAATNQGGEEK